MTVRRLVFIFALLIGAGCVGDGGTTADVSTPQTVAATDDVESTPPVDGTPTEAALEGDRGMRVVPEGFQDCGTVTLTSGWPTTTAFIAEVRASCILEAAESGAFAQQSFNGRDHAGGMTGVIIRVESPGLFHDITYWVDPTGAVTTEQRLCEQLVVTAAEPPRCP